MASTVDPAHWASTVTVPTFTESLKTSVTHAYDGIADQLKEATSLASLIDTAKLSSQCYADLLPPAASHEPLPYAKRFRDEFLQIYGLIVLLSAKVENHLADLCEHHCGDERFGVTEKAHDSARRLLHTVAVEADCEAYRELARDAGEPFKLRNLLVHGDWPASTEFASDGEKARRRLYSVIVPAAFVAKRRPLSNKQLGDIVDGWKTGSERNVSDLFEGQFVSLGLLNALLDTFKQLEEGFSGEVDAHDAWKR